MDNFEVRYESHGFTNNNSILNATFSKDEAHGFTKTSFEEKSFPKRIVGVVDGYITSDDNQNDKDIHVFVSVTLYVQAESEKQVKAMDAPSDLLTKISDLMATDLELESYTWKVMEVEKLAVEFGDEITKAQSYGEAEEIAKSKGSWTLINGNENTIYVGEVLGITAHHVVQSLGRSAAIHHKHNLDRIPTKGEMIDIAYDGLQNGKIAQSVTAQDKSIFR